MIDAGVFIGRNPVNGNELTESGLLNYCADVGVRKIMVSSYESVFYDYRSGNFNLIKLFKKHPDLIVPAAVISLYGVSNTEAYIDYLKNEGVNIISFYITPKYYDVNPESMVLRNIVQTASEKGFTIQFGLENIFDLIKVVRTLNNIKTNFLIRWMNGRGYFNIAEILSICRNYKNFYFDIGSINSLGGMEYLVECTGADRFFFSSGIPDCFQHTQFLLINDSKIKKKDKHTIFNNPVLNRLCGISEKNGETDGYGITPNIWKQMKSMEKIDMHVHYDSWNFIDPYREINVLKQKAHDFNIKKVIVSSSKALNYDMNAGNSKINQIIKKDKKNLFYGYIVVDPLNPSESAKEIIKYASNNKFVGIKTIQDLYNIKLCDERYDDIFKIAAEYDLPVLAHIPGLQEASSKHKAVKFIAAHSTFKRVRHLLSCENVYFDIATSHNDLDETRLEVLIDKVGVEKILFGSDAPLISPVWTIAKVIQYKLSSSDRRKIFYQNAEKLFRLN